MGRDIYGYGKMKKVSIITAIEQLRLRGEDAVPADRLDRHDIFINDKGVRIKIKFSKPIRRSSIVGFCWEFTNIVHGSRLWPYDVYHYYILMGLDENGGVKKIWKMPTNDDMIYRKNQIFIPLDRSDDYNKYELEIINNDNDDEDLLWID